MPFSGIKFLGATVRSIQSSLGLNEQKSQLNLNLVVDVTDGDVFTLPSLGTPATFVLDAFTFSGILQKYGQSNRIDGFPTYSVTVEDPRDILAGTKVILNNYVGGTITVANLLNAYGYIRNLGDMSTNESGMKWSLVKAAIHDLTSGTVNTIYGGPLSYRGYSYRVDLSAIPQPPANYRISGDNLSILDIISHICTDAGCDFYVELVGNVIAVRVISRFNQPPLGTIFQLINQNTGNVISNEDGVELRNETTSAFLVGGPIQYLSLFDSTYMTQYWGLDAVGNPITPYLFAGLDNITNTPVTTMNLNASPVADIVGSLTYTCNINELRFALSSYTSWATYMTNSRLDGLAGAVGLLSIHKPMNQNLPINRVLKGDLVDGNKQKVEALGQVYSGAQTDTQIKCQRLYEFVRNYAKDFWGKKYLVSVASISSNTDPETQLIVHSEEPTDGGFLPDGSDPLGLVGFNNDTFQTQDGRYISFVRFDNLVGADLSALNPSEVVVQGTSIFMKCYVDPNIILYPSAYVVITLHNPIYEIPVDSYGGVGIIGTFLTGFENAQKSGAFGTLDIKVHPLPHDPDYAAIPLKSNVSRYGPWTAVGPPGKVDYLVDESLVPWNYGGFTYMNLAGQAKVLNTITNMQVSEAGQLELAGLPIAGLGGTMMVGGPNISNITIQYGTNGVSTSYRFETYTQRFGVFSRDNAERIRRIGLIGQTLKKESVQTARELATLGRASERAYAGFNANMAKYFAKASPYETLGAEVVPAGSSVAEGYRVGMCAATTEELYGILKAHDPSGYPNTAGASWTALFRPFSTYMSVSGAVPTGTVPYYLPTYTSPHTGLPANTITSVTYNPFQAYNDIEMYPWGDNFNDSLHNFRLGTTTGSARPICLRGPLIIAGFGMGVDGTWYPGASSVFNSGVLRRFDTWKVGALDPLWDDHRGIWTCHDMLYGKVSGVTPPGSATFLYLHAERNMPLNRKHTVYNPWSTSVSGGSQGTYAMATYNMLSNKWMISSLDC